MCALLFVRHVFEFVLQYCLTCVLNTCCESTRYIACVCVVFSVLGCASCVCVQMAAQVVCSTMVLRPGQER